MSDLMIFQRILPGCEQGSREAWTAFLSNYTPIAFRLFDMYLPLPAGQRGGFWREALGALVANNFERLRTFDHQSEREFLTDLRAFLLERGAGKLDPSQDSTAAPAPTPETVADLLKGLPLLHQEVLFFKLSGYSSGGLEKLLRITPAVAQKGLERLQADYSALLEGREDGCLWPAAWAEVTRFVRAAEKEECGPLRQFVRIQDGQVSWYDKDPVEEHVSGCLHCLERWTALREIAHWRREVNPRPLAELDLLLSSLPVQTGSKQGKSIGRRIFGS